MATKYIVYGDERPCGCGCGKLFRPAQKNQNGVSFFPEYARGHHPNCRKTQTLNKKPWNTGLTKESHPRIAKMGFQKGHMLFLHGTM
jgi:hypothetical protein